MNIEEFRLYCLSKPGVEEGLPFGPDVLVFKVGGKMFALCPLEPFDSINLKCDPELAIQLREQYPAVQPGYHMNKKHWNTIMLGDGLADAILKEWIDHSYQLVKASLPAKTREKLG
ncbi:MAG: MmcQ/YjbR family DNA-binding protein [Flavobacteriales bacterium]|nr:MmcQ/YjbR family DNA-binding protein [Flavobacteriales bacterium]